MASLNIDRVTDENTDVTTVKLTGSLDTETVALLRQELFSLVGDAKIKLIINMEGLSYMSSSGIGTFIGVIKRVREKGGDIIFVHPTSTVFRVLETLGLTKIFKIIDRNEDAVAELQKSVTDGLG